MTVHEAVLPETISPGSRIHCEAVHAHILLSAAALRERSEACLRCGMRDPCRSLFGNQVVAKPPGQEGACWVVMATTGDQTRCAGCSVQEHCHDLVLELGAVARSAKSH